MSTLHDERPTEWTVEELPREPGQPKKVRVFRYVYRTVSYQLKIPLDK